MTFKLTYYTKIKDKYCFGYFGYNGEYLVQLKLVKPCLEQTYPELEIYLSCNKNLFYLIENEKNVLVREDLYENKRSFGNIEEIKYNTKSSNPIFELLNNSNIPCPVITTKSEIQSNLCLLTNKCCLPVKEADLSSLRDKIESKGFAINDNPTMNDLKNAGWVVGVENEILYTAASMGIKTTLVSTGISTKMFKIMFPSAEVL